MQPRALVFFQVLSSGLETQTRLEPTVCVFSFLFLHFTNDIFKLGNAYNDNTRLKKGLLGHFFFPLVTNNKERGERVSRFVTKSLQSRTDTNVQLIVLFLGKFKIALN